MRPAHSLLFDFNILMILIFCKFYNCVYKLGLRATATVRIFTYITYLHMNHKVAANSPISMFYNIITIYISLCYQINIHHLL